MLMLTTIVLLILGLDGPIPTEFGLLTNLKELTLTKNFLSSSIPTEIGSLFTLSSFSAGFNRLTGQIPDEITQLRGLTELFLENNCK